MLVRPQPTVCISLHEARALLALVSGEVLAADRKDRLRRSLAHAVAMGCLPPDRRLVARSQMLDRVATALATLAEKTGVPAAVFSKDDYDRALAELHERQRTNRELTDDDIVVQSKRLFKEYDDRDLYTVFRTRLEGAGRDYMFLAEEQMDEIQNKVVEIAENAKAKGTA